jgi:hypothetical protein
VFGNSIYKEEIFGPMKDEVIREWEINEEFHVLLLLA